LFVVVQVIIGAAITALGPSGGDHILAITILGALNTSIAGILALLKGRGLPQRLRRNVAELEKVLNHIEEQSILLRYGRRRDSNDEIDSLIEDTLRRYAIAENVIERNQPDTYTEGSTPFPGERPSASGSLNQTKNQSNAIGKRREPDEEMGADGSFRL
jgi:hypothetical protein